MASYIRAIIRWRWPALLLLLASLAVALYSARTLRARFQFTDFYTYPSNKALPLYVADNEEFGDPAGYVIAMIEADEVFQPRVLEFVSRLTNALAPEPSFKRIISLTNTSAIRAHGDEVMSGPLLPELPKTAAELAEVRQFALHSPLLLRRLISSDSKTTAVLAQMRTPAVLATIDQQSAAIDTLTRVLAQNPPPAGVHVRVTGAPRVEVQTTHALTTDQLVLTPAIIALLVVMLYVTFRSFHGVMLALAAVTTATVWTAGIFALFGRPADMISSIVPTTILVYGVVDPIFVLTRVLQKLDAGRAKQAAISEAFSELALPCVLTSVTTATGFAAFATAAVPAVRYFGITVAIGVMLAWVTTYTLLPVLLAFAPVPKRRLQSSRLGRVIDRALYSTWSMLRGRSQLAVIISIVLFGFGAAFAATQRISNHYVGSLPRGQTRNDVDLLQKRLTGVIRLVVHFEGPEDSMKRPEVLRAIAQIDRAAEADPLVTVSLSLADVVAEANQAFNNGDVAERKIPNSPTLIGQYLSLVDRADRAELASDDYARSRIAILVDDQGGNPTLRLARDLQRHIDEAGLGALGVKAELTGNGIVAYPELDRIVVELLWGFVFALLAIVLLQAALFRSLRLALISVIPNLLPVIACFSVTRLFAIDLRIDTCLVLCVSVGGLFNTTIHYSARVLQRIAEGERDPDEILLHSLRAVGPPSLFTAVVLSAGFTVLTLSSFYGLQVLGLLSMITLLTGFVSDMVVTTAFLRATFDWDAALSRVSQPALPRVSTHMSPPS